MANVNNISWNSSFNTTTSPVLANIQALIAQLTGQGTPEIQQQRATRNEEVQSVRNQRQQYTKDQAEADAQMAVEATQRRSLEQLLPSINNAARGSGTSQSSMRALLLQDAAQRAADSAALLKTQTVKDYGSISASLNNTLEALTRVDAPQTDALLKALQLGNQAQNTTSSGNGSSASTANRNVSAPVVTVNPGKSWAESRMEDELLNQARQRTRAMEIQNNQAANQASGYQKYTF